MLTPRQQLEIYTSFEKDNFLPLELAYFAPESKTLLTEFYFKKMVPTRNRGFFYRERQLTSEFVEYFLTKLNFYNKVNLINVGPDLSYSVAPYLMELQDCGKLGSYVLVNPVESLSQDDIQFDKISVTANPLYDSFEEVQAIVEKGSDTDSYINVFTYFNEKISKHTKQGQLDVLNNIRTSMRDEDILVLTFPTDNSNTVNLLNNHRDIGRCPQLALFDLIGVGKSDIDYVCNYDDKEKSIVSTAHFLRPVEIFFDLPEDRKSLKYDQNSTMTAFYSRLYSFSEFEDMIKQAGFYVSDASFAKVESYAIAVLKKR
jgi:hypothetical protein